MDVAYFRRLFAYDDWANAAHLQALADSGDPPARGVAAMAHVLAARQIWLLRITGQPTDGTTFNPPLDLDGCRALHEQVQADWQSYLQAMDDDAQLLETVTFHDTFGNPYTLDRRTMLTHTLLHSAHHRGQAAMSQRQSGQTPADADLYIAPMAGE